MAKMVPKTPATEVTLLHLLKDNST